jgi:predicted nucleic acid-binding protein
MPEPARRVYWDACVFLSYINNYAGRAATIGALLDEAARGDIELVTSVLTVVEVSFGAVEQQRQRLSPDIEARINQLWLPSSPVKLVELHRLVADGARALVREAVGRGWSLKPADAVHLGTAQQLRVSEFHTYDERLPRFGSVVGFVIRQPFTPRPRLPNT